MRDLRPFVVLMFAVVFALILSPSGSQSAAQAAPRGVTPTLAFVNFYGLASTLDGKPLPVGTRLTAYDPQGIECGEFEVHTEGQYGVLPVYGDDLTTPEDEGAIAGDLISFRINGVPARLLGPHEARWTANGDLKHVELAANMAAGTATPGPATATAIPTTAPGQATASPVTTSAPGQATATAAPASPTPGQAVTPAPATATPAAAAPTVGVVTTPTSPALPSPAASGISPTPGAAAPTPASGQQPSPTPAAVGQASPFPGQSSPTPERASTVLAASSPQAAAILGLPVESPTAGATVVNPGQQSRPQVGGSGTPAGPAGGVPHANDAVSQVGADSGSLVIGMAVILIVVPVFLWLRRRFL